MSEVFLDRVLKPSPPMPPRVLLVILAIVATLNAAFAVSFILQGAWPVMPFMGLDVALLAWAFRASTRNAQREEHVVVTRETLRIARRMPWRPSSETRLNPYWVRVHMDDPPEHGSQLTLWSHGKGLRVGTFLGPAERASFAQSLKAALAHARTASFGS